MAPITCAATYTPTIVQVISARSAKARLTAGLKCAPDVDAKIRMSTASMAPVASVLQSGASARLPPASRCAMIPEPTTAASRNAVPSASPKTRRTSVGISRARSCRRLRPPCGRSPSASIAARADRGCGSATRPRLRSSMQHPIDVFEGQRDLGGRTRRFGGIGHAPMGGHRLPRPDRTNLACGVVADGEHEIERRRAGLGELAPGFRAEGRGVVAETGEQGQGARIDLALRLASRRIGAKLSCAELVEDRFGDDRTRRIAGAEKQRVEHMFGLAQTAGRGRAPVSAIIDSK